MQLRAAKGGATDGQVVFNSSTGITSTVINESNCGTLPAVQVPVIQVINSSIMPDRLRLLVPDGSAWGEVSVKPDITATPIQVRTSGGSLDIPVNAWALLINTAYSASLLFKVTSVSGTAPDVLLGKEAFSVPGASTDFPSPPGDFAVGNMILRGRWLEYRVQSQTLMVKDLLANTEEPAATGIEDLQVAVAIDQDFPTPNGVIGPEQDTLVDGDEWVYNIAGETLPGAPATFCGKMPIAAPLTNLTKNILGVRITIVARASSADPGAFVAPPRAEDHVPNNPPRDGIFRVKLQTVVALRNVGITP
jgi:hypothetical protein